MPSLSPIYSIENECHDCYKCIRECPVKAIRVENGHAAILPEACILCGHCVEICPAGAKRVRDDVPKVQAMLRQDAPVVVSLAPSFAGEFPDASPAQLICALKKLGFAEVSETALGAQQVSEWIARELADSKGQVWYSTACPTAVKLINNYLPAQSDRLTPVVSPLLAHAKTLKQDAPEKIRVVFVGPCIAKKSEADEHPELLDASLTFGELRRWLEEAGIRPGMLNPNLNDVFVPEGAADGALYPLEGGMLTTLEHRQDECDWCRMALSGVKNIYDSLKDTKINPGKSKVFIELLGCQGGCVRGPGMTDRSVVSSRLDVLSYARSADVAGLGNQPRAGIGMQYRATPPSHLSFLESEITQTLKRLGKTTSADELNCGGCGYETCRGLAQAILANKAEPQMCVSYMRKLAQKKANALIRTLPHAVVIVNRELNIIECNENFPKLFGEDVELAYNARPGLAGASLERLVPFSDLFAQVLKTGEEIIYRNVRMGEAMVTVTIFNVEEHQVVGGLMLDVTRSEMRRDEIIKRARQVIHNTSKTGQEIAFLLGKNAAQSELILSSIIKSFSAESVDEND
jgi:iron only hydrogenase large subunit-like protein